MVEALSQMFGLEGAPRSSHLQSGPSPTSRRSSSPGRATLVAASPTASDAHYTHGRMCHLLGIEVSRVGTPMNGAGSTFWGRSSLLGAYRAHRDCRVDRRHDRPRRRRPNRRGTCAERAPWGQDPCGWGIWGFLCGASGATERSSSMLSLDASRGWRSRPATRSWSTPTNTACNRTAAAPSSSPTGPWRATSCTIRPTPTTPPGAEVTSARSASECPSGQALRPPLCG